MVKVIEFRLRYIKPEGLATYPLEGLILICEGSEEHKGLCNLVLSFTEIN